MCNRIIGFDSIRLSGDESWVLFWVSQLLRKPLQLSPLSSALSKWNKTENMFAWENISALENFSYKDKPSENLDC